MESNKWFNDVKYFPERLVGLRSISSGRDENLVVREILRLLHTEDLESVYTDSGLDAVLNDLHKRSNVYGFLCGERTATIILLGHSAGGKVHPLASMIH